MDINRDIVGVLPAAGHARRLGLLPCSKEILPVRIDEARQDGVATEVASGSVLRALVEARVERAHFLIREEKWDIVQYWGSGARAKISLSYHVVEDSPATVVTIDAAYPFLRDRTIAFGFPDVIYQAPAMFSRLLERQEESGAEIVLALFPVADPAKVDTVNVSREGHVREIRVKSASSPFGWAWAAAVWTPKFTEFLHQTVHTSSVDGEQELFLGELMTRGQRQGLTVDSVSFPDGGFYDVGTPDEWRSVLTRAPGEALPPPEPRAANGSIPAVHTLRQPLHGGGGGGT